MNAVEWFYTIMSMGFGWAILSFPYLVEKFCKLFK
jgi:hypothetical protein